MGSFYTSLLQKKTLVLIIALVFSVYNSQAQKGIGQQKPVKIAGMLAATLLSFEGAVGPASKAILAYSFRDRHTVEP